MTSDNLQEPSTNDLTVTGPLLSTFVQPEAESVIWMKLKTHCIKSVYYVKVENLPNKMLESSKDLKILSIWPCEAADLAEILLED